MPTYPDISRSLELYQAAGERIPGWTQLISRRADQFANGVSPIYAQRAKGSRFNDVNENEYIDWVNAVGAIILGHADGVVDGADYTVWADHFGIQAQELGPKDGDFNCDGEIDGADYTIWADHFGKSTKQQ